MDKEQNHTDKTLTWRVIYVNSRAEKKVMESLLKKNIEAYVPIQKVLKHWSDRKKWVETPLFNGYVFVNINAEQREHVMQTAGVVNFLRMEGKDAVVRSNEIENLKQLIDTGYSISTNRLSENFSLGDLVKITNGPLKGIEGVVSRLGDGQVLEIIVGAIGQVIRVTLPKDITSIVSQHFDNSNNG